MKVLVHIDDAEQWRDALAERLPDAEVFTSSAPAEKRREAARCLRAGERARSRLESLARRSESVKPSRLQAAQEAVQDAEALLKIASDQVLIAENQVRKIIVEEFPPKRHERMRRRYLPGDAEDGKPFTF